MRYTLLAVDPGPEHSAWLFLDASTGKILQFGKDSVADVRRIVREAGRDGIPLAIEIVIPYGATLGRSTLTTCEEVGRLETLHGGRVARAERPDVVRHITGHLTRKGEKKADTRVREHLIWRYVPGWDKYDKKGTLKTPEVLEGVSSDIWSALAVGCYAMDCRRGELFGDVRKTG